MHDDDYQALAVKRLRELAEADMRVWRQRVNGMDACDDETMVMPHEVAKIIGYGTKRVRRAK